MEEHRLSRERVHAERLAVERGVDERMSTPLVEPREDLTEPVSEEVDGHRIGNRWPVRQTPTDLAAAYEPLPVAYVGRHRFGERTDVTAEFHRIVRHVVFDEDLVDVT